MDKVSETKERLHMLSWLRRREVVNEQSSVGPGARDGGCKPSRGSSFSALQAEGMLGSPAKIPAPEWGGSRAARDRNGGHLAANRVHLTLGTRLRPLVPHLWRHVRFWNMAQSKGSEGDTKELRLFS